MVGQAAAGMETAVEGRAVEGRVETALERVREWRRGPDENHAPPPIAVRLQCPQSDTAAHGASANEILPLAVAACKASCRAPCRAPAGWQLPISPPPIAALSTSALPTGVGSSVPTQLLTHLLDWEPKSGALTVASPDAASAHVTAEAEVAAATQKMVRQEAAVLEAALASTSRPGTSSLAQLQRVIAEARDEQCTTDGGLRAHALTAVPTGLPPVVAAADEGAVVGTRWEVLQSTLAAARSDSLAFDEMLCRM